MPEVAVGLEGLPAHDAHELGVLPEEAEAGDDDPLDLGPALAGVVTRRGDLDPSDPLQQGGLEDLLVDGVLGGEVVQDAGSADADALGDVVERGAVVAVLRRSLGAPRAGSPHVSTAPTAHCATRLRVPKAAS